MPRQVRAEVRQVERGRALRCKSPRVTPTISSTVPTAYPDRLQDIVDPDVVVVAALVIAAVGGLPGIETLRSWVARDIYGGPNTQSLNLRGRRGLSRAQANNVRKHVLALVDDFR